MPDSRSASERGERAEGPKSPREQGRRHLVVKSQVSDKAARRAAGSGGFERTAFQDAFSSSPREARKAENRQIFQDSGKYFLEHHFPQSVAVTRGQGQSPALEGSAHANFRVTSPPPKRRTLSKKRTP